MQHKYQEIRDKEVRYECQNIKDADYAIVAFGSAARISQKAMESARKQGLKVGLFRPITLWPFPLSRSTSFSSFIEVCFKGRLHTYIVLCESFLIPDSTLLFDKH